MKPFKPEEGGVLMDANFKTHVALCELCQRFDEEIPSTAAQMCLEGSVLWKREHPSEAKRGRLERPSTWRSMDEIMAVTKYK